jgi:hypothetical protein
VLAIDSSGRLAETLAEFESTTIYKLLSYEIPDVDGSLMWMRVSAVELVGTLYQPGMLVAMLQTELASRRKLQRAGQQASGLRQGDPLSGKGCGRWRPNVGGRRGGGKGRGIPTDGPTTWMCCHI